MGDSWISVAARTGVSVAELQSANPRSMRENEWLIVGETLVIPGETTSAAASGTVTGTVGVTQTGAVETGAQTYIVQAGESWNSIAAKFNTTRRLLQAANPLSIRYGEVLLRGEKLVIPPPDATEADIEQITATPTATITARVTSTLTAEATEEAILVPTAEATATPTVGPTQAPIETPTALPTGAPTEVAVVEAPIETTITASETIPTQGEMAPTTAITTTQEAAGEAGATVCPKVFASYPDLLADLVNSPAGGIEGVLGFLRQCSAIAEENLKSGDWTGDGADDLAVVITNPQSDASAPETDLLIFASDGERYDLAYHARAAGTVSILSADDINGDGKPDIVWVDTTCGASTCFDTVNVRSWDGATWADWTDKMITMAYADITLDDLRDTSQGQEIELIGGVYGSVGAGPQRGRTEIWGSVEGAPYMLVEKVYDRSNCLYHKVLDANEALQRYQEIGLVQAKEMYTEAVTNANLTKCWEHDNELDELRSFSLFRLALISAYEGRSEEAAEYANQLHEGFADSIFAPLGQAWLAAYQPGNDIGAACMAATQFAKANPVSYESLSDYGYANPSFQAEDLCPILNIDVPQLTAEAGAAEGSEEVTTEADAEAAPGVQATATMTVEATIEPIAVLTATLPAASSSEQEGELPPCPTSLDVYATIMPDVIAVSEADPLIVETWLRLCDGMADDRGGMLMSDINGDPIEDALFLPTIVSDLGFGPEGTQGAVLIYHGQPDGGYNLVYNPEIFGQPTLIGTGDFNGDGRPDVAWTVEGCSTFCIKEVQVLSWNPETESYDTIIEPGATIAEGTATFEELPAGALGKGQQLTLQGGVSGTSDGGLDVPHVEAWQAVDGRNFRRLSWTYDRNTRGNDCLGLRLIEADAALQAADILGYAVAADLYQATLDPALRACSIYGIPGDQELLQLRGLGYFRLVQTQALSGTLDSAKQTLSAMIAEQPETTFTNAATQWLAEYERSGSGVAACEMVQTLFDRDTVTWQITDHFGYNHPALAAEQVCFVPAQEVAK
jgi:LysM repeat protein